MPGFYDRIQSKLPIDTTDLTPAGPEPVTADPAQAPEAAASAAEAFAAEMSEAATPAAPSADIDPATGLPRVHLPEAAPDLGFQAVVDAGPASREAALAPEGTLADRASTPLGDADRAIATEIAERLKAWEREYRATNQLGAMVTQEQMLAQLARLVTEQRGRLVAPDEAVAAHILAMKEGLFGFETLLANPRVSDILLNDWDLLFVEEGGELTRRKSPLRSPADLNELVQRVVNRAGGSVDMSNPIYDDQFPYPTADGVVNVRVNVNLGHLTVSRSPTLSLRKPVAGGFDQLDNWAKPRGDDPEPPLSAQAVEFLRFAALGRANILLVGGTGSGKTSLMKALLRAVRREERVVVVEEANELDLRGQLENYVGLVANDQPNQRLSNLIRSAMRMRPDRIIVGECRDGSEVGAFLRAINTGHAGSFTTIHASSAVDGLQAMLTLAAMDAGSKSPVEHVGRLIHPGIDLIIYLGASYLPGRDGILRRTRRVIEIATINEFRVNDGRPEFILQHVFDRSIGSGGVSQMRSIDAPLQNKGFAGLSDSFVARMRSQGVDERALRGVLEAQL